VSLTSSKSAACCPSSLSLLVCVFFSCVPELSVGMTTEGIDVHSVGNTLVLHETALIEASNLKAAIEYQQKNRERSAVLFYY